MKFRCELMSIQARDEFFRYMSKKVEVSWCAGILSNLELPAFRSAWDEVKDRTDSFAKLRLLENQNSPLIRGGDTAPQRLAAEQLRPANRSEIRPPVRTLSQT